jgi:hypothetical protein
MSDMIINEVVKQLQTMPDNLQKEVLHFSQKLNTSTPVGISGSKLLQFVGTIPQEDLEIMRQAIESDCEQVDLNEW